MMKGFIKKILKENLNEMANGDIWYHGTPDVRELEIEGGFSKRSKVIDYITDMNIYQEMQAKLKEARESGDEDRYFDLLYDVPKLKSNFTLRSPIFVTNDKSVARTYADPHRAFNFQEAVEKVLKVSIPQGKCVTIDATGEHFRFINVNNVRRGFINAGVSEEQFNEVLAKFTYHQNNDKGIRTDMIAVIGEWFEFDYIDVLGVLDSYEGGTTKSTVRMIFDSSSIKIIN